MHRVRAVIQSRTTDAVSVGRRKKPFAFIEFLDYKDAQDAKEDWDRREFFGRVIEVVFAQQKRPSLANPSLKLTHACAHARPDTPTRPLCVKSAVFKCANGP